MTDVIIDAVFLLIHAHNIGLSNLCRSFKRSNRC